MTVCDLRASYAKRSQALSTVAIRLRVRMAASNAGITASPANWDGGSTKWRGGPGNQAPSHAADDRSQC